MDLLGDASGIYFDMPLAYGSHGSMAVLLERCKKFGLSWETTISVFCAMLAATVDMCISSLFPSQLAATCLVLCVAEECTKMRRSCFRIRRSFARQWIHVWRQFTRLWNVTHFLCERELGSWIFSRPSLLGSGMHGWFVGVDALCPVFSSWSSGLSCLASWSV